MPDREIRNSYAVRVTVDKGSWSNIVIAQSRNMYSGVIYLPNGVLFMSALAKSPDGVEDHYQTKTPEHLGAFPLYVSNLIADPLVHKDPGDPDNLTSHHKLAQIVEKAYSGVSDDDLGGFSLRMETAAAIEKGQRVVKGTAKLSPTSRTLNPGLNGSLEDCIIEAIAKCLEPKLALLGWNLAVAMPRTNIDHTIQKYVPQASQQQLALRKGLFAGIKKPQ